MLGSIRRPEEEEVFGVQDGAEVHRLNRQGVAKRRGFLRALPDPAPDTTRHLEARITRDGFCRVGDVDYSVPPGLQGRWVAIRSSLTQVVITLEGREISHHRRSYVPADVVISPEHARALRLAREARAQLHEAAIRVPEVDLARYDALAEAAS